ncbi:MAG: hypothetical protein JF609_07335 [Verrucomicrobia bacterium]|nr:hypothetical protein [Verrucomicrobiota bacterium]
MIARLTFLGIVVFWVAMNVILWRAEYGVLGGDTPVPFQLVWRKILTAPDASSLSVYQNHERMGYAEFSTSVGQSMAALDEDKLPPEGLVKKAGYQVHLAGNVALGDFTNRVKFDGRVLFDSARQWQEFTLKITSRMAVVELHSVATNQIVHVKISGEAVAMERDFTFADLQSPNTLVRAFAGNFADALLGPMELPDFPEDTSHNLTWDARRTRVRIGTEAVPVYRLETSALGHPVVVDVSTLGEIRARRRRSNCWRG